MSEQRPYLGLRPYEYSDRENFFGRDADCEILVDKLLSNRLTLLFAASGVGKSSLLNAAVLPLLKDPLGENLSVVYHNDWVLKPLDALKDSIRSSVPAAKQAPSEQTLAELLKFCSLFIRHPFVLILDQFEEFFRYQRGKEDFELLIQQLTVVILEAEIPVNIVISMREDFALELNAFKPRLPTLLFENYYRLEKMKPEAARDAIVRPAEQYRFGYEPALVSQLVDDLSSHKQIRHLSNLAGIESEKLLEPTHIQIICEYLWENKHHNEKNLILLSSYEAAGGANGIFRSFTNSVQSGFSRAEQVLASKAFDYLIAHSGVKIAYSPKVLAKIIKVDDKKLSVVLDKLASKDVRILRKQSRKGIHWYELYHDMFSLSIERWNNEWKAKRLKTRRWVISSLGMVMLSVIILLVESLLWIQRHNFPLDNLFTEQRYRLISWGFLKPPIPEVVEIPFPKTDFKMGEQDLVWRLKQVDDTGDEGSYGSPVVGVKILKPFFMGRFEVTYDEYDFYVWSQLKLGLKKVGDKTLSYPSGSARENKRGLRPVTYVSWNEAVEYTQWLTKRSKNLGFRLPKESEWEYAARAGTTGPYWWEGSESSSNQPYANCKDCGDSLKKFTVASVGSYPQNQFGLHDTAGNVWEWTCSFFDEYFRGHEHKCANETSGFKVIRGGAYYNGKEWLRSSARMKFGTETRFDSIGFRVLAVPKK